MAHLLSQFLKHKWGGGGGLVFSFGWLALSMLQGAGGSVTVRVGEAVSACGVDCTHVSGMQCVCVCVQDWTGVQ